MATMHATTSTVTLESELVHDGNNEVPSLSPRGYQIEMLEASLKVRQGAAPSLDIYVLTYGLDEHHRRRTIGSGLADALHC